MPYGQQPYGAPPQEHPQGTLILIFGILGIFITIFAPIAWYLGNKARKDIQTSGIQYSNEQNISIGRMLGKVFTIIAIVSIVLLIIFLDCIAVFAQEAQRLLRLRVMLRSTTFRHDNRQCDDCRAGDRKNRDIEGFRTHLKQPSIPARQGDPFHRADSQGRADEQAAQAPGGLAEKADHQTSEHTDHHDQQGPLPQ